MIDFEDCVRLYKAVWERFRFLDGADVGVYVGRRRAYDLSRLDPLVWPTDPQRPVDHPRYGLVRFIGTLLGMRVHEGDGLPEMTALVEHDTRRFEFPWGSA